MGTLGLSLLIAAGVAYYVLAYVPQKTAELNGRYFRVLERIGLNVQHKIEAQFRVQEGIAWRIQQLPAPPGRPVAPDALVAHWRKLNRETPGLAFERLDKPPGNPTQAQPRASLDSAGRVRFFQPLLAQGPGAGRALVCSLPLDSLVRPLRRPDVFKYFVIFNPATNRLLFSNSAGVLAGGQRTGRPPGWLSDTTGLRAGKTADFTLQGQPYHLFAQPLRLVAGADWLLCGAVPAAEFDAERHAISAATLETSLSLLLLGLLALPFLKLAFMSARERLGRADVFLCAASLVLGSGLVVLGIQSFVMRHWLERDQLEGQLATLNGMVQNNLMQELQGLSATARTADALLRARYGTAPRPAAAHDSLQAATGPPAARLPWQPQQPDSSDLLLWIDAGGRGRVALARRHAPNYIADLSSRRYFRAAQQIGPARQPTEPAYYFESIISYKDTRTIAALAQPSTWANLRAGPAGPPGVCLLSTALRCLAQPVLPPGYSFCLIDERGEVLFHSDARLSLSENLLDDADASPELRAAIFAKEKTFAESSYQGRPSLLYLQPLAAEGLAIPERYVVTIASLADVQDWQLQTLSEAAALLLAFWTLLAVVAGVVLATAPRSRLLLAVRHSFPRLWPRRDYAGRYARIVAAHGLGLAGLTLTAMFVSPLAQVFLLLLLPLYLYPLTYQQLRLQSERQWHPATWRLGLLALLAVLLNVFFGRWMGWVELWPVLLFQLGLLAVVGALGWPGALLPPQLAGRAWPARVPRPTYRLCYAAMLLSWILVLSIVPSLYCYQIADGVERMYQIRYTHLSLLQQLHQQAVRRQAQADAAQYYHFFFSTNLSKKPLISNKKDLNDWKTLNYSILMSRKFYGLVHHSFAANASGTKRALPTSAADADELVRWGVARPTGLNAKTATYVSKADGRLWLRSQTSPLFGTGLQWFSGAGLGGYASQWFNPLWVLPLLLLGLLYLLYRLVRYAVRWIFAPVVLTHRDLVLPLHASAHCYAGLIHRLLLTPAASILGALPEEEKGPLARAAPALLDCRTLPTLDKLDHWLSANVAYPAATVVLEHFEYDPQDPEQTERKQATVEWLVRKKHRVVVLSRLHPAAFADCGHALEHACPVAGHARIQQAGAALLEALAYFRAEYLPLQPYRSPLPLADFQREWTPRQRRLLRRECASMPFLQRLYQPLRQVMRQRWALGQRLDPDNIVLTVQRMAQFYYRSLWQMLSPQEQFFLYDMAQDGLVNPRSLPVLDTLLQKGFLKIDTHGRLRLVNDSFRSFILSSVRQRQALRFEQDGAPESTWATLHLPLLLLLTSGALFIFVTQRAAMTQAQQFLTAFVSLLPLLGRLLSGLSPFSNNSAKADTKM